MRSGFNSTVKHSPPIDISEYLLSMRLAVDTLKVLSYPFDEVVFECTFDDLVEEIR